MILVDTSVWVDHFRRKNERLIRLLEEGEVYCHEFVIGELTLGHLKNREEILTLLQALPQVSVAQHGEALAFVSLGRLFGKGIGWIDLHLLASARLGRAGLWTLDKKLAQIASDLGISPF